MENREPRFGYKNLIKSKKDGKVRAFFSLMVPTDTEFGTLEIAGFKVIEGSKGLFVSFPNRAVKTNTQQVIDVDNGTSGTVAGDGTKYYNNLRFESQEKYQLFRDELNNNVLPLIKQELATV